MLTASGLNLPAAAAAADVKAHSIAHIKYFLHMDAPDMSCQVAPTYDALATPVPSAAPASGGGGVGCSGALI